MNDFQIRRDGNPMHWRAAAPIVGQRRHLTLPQSLTLLAITTLILIGALTHG